MTIVCATDFSEPAEAAEARAIALARSLGADVLFVHVAVEAPLYGEGPFTMHDATAVFETQRRWAEKELAGRVATATARGVVGRAVVKVGVPVDEITQIAADEKADMIVIGTHGRSGLGRLLLGSVAERVVRMAPCPVLTVGPGTAYREEASTCASRS